MQARMMRRVTAPVVLVLKGLPPKFLDVQEHLVALAKLATKRV